MAYDHNEAANKFLFEAQASGTQMECVLVERSRMLEVLAASISGDLDARIVTGFVSGWMDAAHEKIFAGSPVNCGCCRQYGFSKVGMPDCSALLIICESFDKIKAQPERAAPAVTAGICNGCYTSHDAEDLIGITLAHNGIGFAELRRDDEALH